MMLLFMKAKQKYLQNLNVTLHGTGGLSVPRIKIWTTKNPLQQIPFKAKREQPHLEQ